MIFHDNETDIDLLNFEVIVRTIKNLIISTKGSPITIGVHGDWGAGKTSILKMLENSFEKDDKVVCIWFNSWLFQDFEDSKIVLLENILTQLLESRKIHDKFLDEIYSLILKINWLKLIKVGGSIGTLALSQATGYPEFLALLPLFNNITTINNDEIKKRKIEEFVNVISELKETGSNVPKQIQEIRKSFEELLSKAKIDQLIVLIDDLDRCLPKTIIQTLEAIKLFLFVPNMVFIIGADESIIEYSVKQYFPDIPLSVTQQNYAKNYLEKLIQIPFRIPSLGQKETLAYLLLLLTYNELAEKNKFKELRNLLFEKIGLPWTTSSIDADFFKNSVEIESESIKESIFIANQIATILTEGTKGNPRQIKRFINTLFLRQDFAKERGLDEYIKIRILSKLMLLEYFKPDTYQKIGEEIISSIEGKSENLKLLISTYYNEDEANRGKVKTDKDNMQVPDDFFGDLEKDNWFRNWLDIKPDISDIDLRPYYFISREKRRLYSSTLLSDHLKDTLEVLASGEKYKIAEISNGIKGLSKQDSEELFNKLRELISVVDDLSNQPKEIDGIVTLCKEHIHLQKPFYLLLNSFPVEKLGPWAASALTNSCGSHELEEATRELLERWSQSEENTKLAKSASAVIKIKK